MPRIAMPKVGYDMEADRISAWLRGVGDPIALGDVISGPGSTGCR